MEELLAQKEELICQYYGVDNIVSETNISNFNDSKYLELDIIQFNDEKLKIFTLITPSNGADNAFKQWKTTHNSMLAAYRIADLDCAAQDCKEARMFSDGSLDQFYKMYLSRIINLTKFPPNEGWSAVFKIEDFG